MTYDQILGDLKKKIYHPVYFLCGEEAYYIDALSEYFDSKILSDSEKEFNHTVVYGKEIDLLTVISYARRYPMMSNYQVVIVREAQEMKSLFPKESAASEKKNKKDQKEEKDPFLEYLLKPTPTTILVFCYKYKKPDMRTKTGKHIEKHAVYFESKKLYDDKVPGWITDFAKSKNLMINAKAAALLSEYLGNDLTKIANEIGKLKLNLKEGQEISPAMVIENIGVSKEFNIFELINAIGYRNKFKCFQIIDYFAANPKSNPMVVSISQIYAFFQKVLTYHSLSNRSSNIASSELGIHPYFLNDYIHAAREYSPGHCIRNIGYIREYDMRSKGIGNLSATDGDLMKELVYKILN